MNINNQKELLKLISIPACGGLGGLTKQALSEFTEIQENQNQPITLDSPLVWGFSLWFGAFSALVGTVLIVDISTTPRRYHKAIAISLALGFSFPFVFQSLEENQKLQKKLDTADQSVEEIQNKAKKTQENLQEIIESSDGTENTDVIRREQLKGVQNEINSIEEQAIDTKNKIQEDPNSPPEPSASPVETESSSQEDPNRPPEPPASPVPPSP